MKNEKLINGHEALGYRPWEKIINPIAFNLNNVENMAKRNKMKGDFHEKNE